MSNFIHATLYLTSDENTDEVEWSVELHVLRSSAIEDVCVYLKEQGVSDQELVFVRAELTQSNHILVDSLGTMVSIMMLEVR